jgi:hypothetical protein
MNVAQPTKAQLKKLTSIAEPFAEESAYVMLADGTALAVLYEPENKGLGVHHYEQVDRKGKSRSVKVSLRA